MIADYKNMCAYTKRYGGKWFAFIGSISASHKYRTPHYDELFSERAWNECPVYTADTKEEAKALAVGLVIQGYACKVEEITNE